MKKRILGMMLAVLLIFSNNTIASAITNSKLQSLDSVHEVGTDIYVQHDENNANVYELKKSSTGSTVVYKEIYPKFTAGATWMRDGKYITDTSYDWVCKCGATAPEDYISVKAGEVYFISAYGVGGIKYPDGTFDWQTPVYITDDNGQKVESFFSDRFSSLKGGAEFTIPNGGTRMYITNYNNQGIRLQKKLTLTNAEFDKIAVNSTELQAKIDANYEEYIKDPTLYKKSDKGYITFVNDDTRSGISQYADIFIEKNIPLCLATIPEALVENAHGNKETRLESVRRIVGAGGEVLVHNGAPITADNITDFNTLYSYFVKSKSLLEYYGFDVNGIILAGGIGQLVGNKELAKWSNYFYSYSDLYGEEYSDKNFAIDSVYYHYRCGLSNSWKNIDKMKGWVDDTIAKKSWSVFYFHDFNDITEENLVELLDYINSKVGDDLEIVTYKQMYEKNAVKESELLQNKTYYVSADGTSSIGEDINHPMSLENARKKVFSSGDTILFKRGDTFYGGFTPQIKVTDEDITTISAYGTGADPVFCGYKIVSSADAWEQYSDGVWRVNLKDTTKFSGVQAVDNTTNQIGFVEYGNEQILGRLRASTGWLEYENNYTVDGTYFYIKTENNPYDTFGTMKLATKTNMIGIKSNMKVSNIVVQGTGAHGMLGSGTEIKNVEISDCTIEKIGGSYLSGNTRYGNGIEFYETDVSDVVIKNNIIRSVYDVAFTIQGNKGSGKDVYVIQNVFVENTQDSEIWESSNATGVMNYHFAENISINQGRGWGYEARNDKYPAGHILFWGYTIDGKEDKTDIFFHNNVVYNPRRIYFIEETNGTNLFFRDYDCIKSDYNTYYLGSDATIFRDAYKLETKDDFVNIYKKDQHSTFTALDTEAVNSVRSLAASTYDISKVKSLLPVAHTGTKDVITPATTTSNGKTVKKCTLCDEKISESVINKIASVALSGTSFTCTGSAITPSVIVKDSAGKTVSPQYYTCTYKNNIKSGTATATIVFKGLYSGTVTKNYKLVDRAATKIKSIKNDTKGIKLQWNSVNGAAKYQVFRRVVGNGWVTGWTWIKDVWGSECTDTTAENGKTYEYTIKTVYNSKYGVLSNNAKLKRVAPPKLTTPASISTGIKLSWSKVSGATKYQVFRKQVTSKWETGYTWLADTKNLSFVDTKAVKGAYYVYAIRAVDGTTSGGFAYTAKIKR